MKVTPILKKIAEYLENPNNEAIHNSEDSDDKLIITTNACIQAALILKKAADELEDIELGESLPEDYSTCGDCGYDHSYEPIEAGKWHLANPSTKGKEDVESQDDIRFREGLDDNSDEFDRDMRDNLMDPDVDDVDSEGSGDTSFEEDDMFSGASVQNIKDLGEISRAFENSSDPNLRKQAALFDELLLTIAAPKNWLQEKKAAESERINSLKKKYNETRVEFDKKNATEDTKKAIEKSPVIKEFRTNEYALSTRTCPDHPGVQTQRIDDDSVRCSLDRKSI